MIREPSLETGIVVVFALSYVMGAMAGLGGAEPDDFRPDDGVEDEPVLVTTYAAIEMGASFGHAHQSWFGPAVARFLLPASVLAVLLPG